MRSPKWDDIIARQVLGERFVFLTIEENDGDSQRCGLIRTIYSQGENIVFEMIWMGRRLARGEWEAIHDTFLRVNEQVAVEHDRDSIATFFFRTYLGTIKVFRNNTIDLDPTEIKGIDPINVRKTRAIVYGLHEDADWPMIIERVVHDLGSDGLASVHEQVTIQDEARLYAA